jgi:hypothetical protein
LAVVVAWLTPAWWLQAVPRIVTGMKDARVSADGEIREARFRHIARQRQLPIRCRPRAYWHGRYEAAQILAVVITTALVTARSVIFSE